MTLRAIVQSARDLCWIKAQEIRRDVWRNRALYQDPGSLAWAVDDLRMAFADLLERLSGWAK